jgi:hypothetical protein
MYKFLLCAITAGLLLVGCGDSKTPPNTQAQSQVVQKGRPVLVGSVMISSRDGQCLGEVGGMSVTETWRDDYSDGSQRMRTVFNRVSC